MSVSDGKCARCAAALVDADPATRTAEHARYRATADGIPVKRCPKGCEGLYWAHLDVGVDALDLLHEPETHFCGTKGFLLWKKYACPACGGELTTAPSQYFKFGPLPSSRSPKLTLLLKGPTLACAACKTNYLPSMPSREDAHSLEQDDAVGAAVCKDLVTD